MRSWPFVALLAEEPEDLGGVAGAVLKASRADLALARTRSGPVSFAFWVLLRLARASSEGSFEGELEGL